MKKFISAMLCFVFIFLCSCNGNQNTDTESSNQADSTENMTTDFVLPELSSVNIKTSPDDPYSFFIKERYEEFIESLSHYEPEEYAAFYKRARNIYYFIYDLDKDGTDELIMGDWKKMTIDYEDPNPPKKIFISSIYTIKNGEVMEINTYPWLPDDYIWDRVILTNGLIRTSLGDEKHPHYYFLGFESGEAVLKCAIYDYGDDDGYVQQFADINTSIDITKEEFERLRDEANGNAEVVEINWKFISEYGR